jgi:hypothetical protein
VLVQQLFELGVADGPVGDARGQPVRQLAMPQQGVPADQLLMLLGEVDKAVSARPVELSLGGLHDLPFHLVPWSDDRKLSRDDGLVVGMV